MESLIMQSIEAPSQRHVHLYARVCVYTVSHQSTPTSHHITGVVGMPCRVSNIRFSAKDVTVFIRLVPDKAPYVSWAFAQIGREPDIKGACQRWELSSNHLDKHND